MIRIFSIGLMLALAVGMTTNTANAQLTDDFDSYANNQLLNGVNGWKGWDNSPAVAGRASNTVSNSAPNSILVLNNNDGATGPSTDAINEMGQPSSGQWQFDCEIYVPSVAPGGGSALGIQWFIMQNDYTDGGTKNWSVQHMFSCATGIIMDDFEDPVMDPNSWPGAPILFDTWMKIRVNMDFDTDSVEIRMDINGDGTFVDFGADGVQFTADDELVNWLAYPWSTRGFNNTNQNGLQAMGALDLYGGDDPGGNVNGAAYYDDIDFQLTPSGGCVPPASYTVFRGIQTGGSLASFQMAGDGDVATFNPGFTINNTEAPVWLVFDANAPNATDISVTSTAGTPGIGVRAECWNWSTSMYVQVGAQEDETFNVQTKHTFGPIDAACIDGSGNVRWRIGWRKKGFTINYPWVISVDETSACN